MNFIFQYSGQSTSKGKKVSHVRPTYAAEGSKLPYTFNFNAEIRGKALSKVTTGNKADKIKVTDNKKYTVAKVCHLFIFFHYNVMMFCHEVTINILIR